MSAQYYGVIDIPAWLIDEELDAAIQEEFGYKANGEEVANKDTDFNLSDNGVSSFANYLASWGKFEAIETLLDSKKIPFDRYTSRDCEDEAERIYFRPENGEGKDYTTVALKGLDEVPCIPTDELRTLLALPISEESKSLKELIERYDPQITPLEQYAKSDEEPCRLPEEMTEIGEVEAVELLRKSGYSKVEYMRSDAGYHYLCADVGLHKEVYEMYNFRMERKDTLLPNRYVLCSKSQNTLDWYYSDSLILEPLLNTLEKAPTTLDSADKMEEIKKALTQLASAYDSMATAWWPDMEGPENFGGTLAELGVLPEIPLDTAAAEILHLLNELEEKRKVVMN